MQSTPESGGRTGWDGAKKKNGSKVHMAVDTLGHLLALLVTPANHQERAQVAELANAVQQTTGQSVGIAYVDQGYTDPEAAEAAQGQGIRLEVVKLPEARKASCFCRAVGWSSVSSGGPPGSGVWPAIMSVCGRRCDVDAWLRYYNEDRPHNGHYCYGKTPMQTWQESKHLAQAKMPDERQLDNVTQPSSVAAVR